MLKRFTWIEVGSPDSVANPKRLRRRKFGGVVPWVILLGLFVPARETTNRVGGVVFDP